MAGTAEVALLHNRLTHSLKVGQVGRKIGATLLYLAREERVRQACYKYGGASLSDIENDIGPIDPWVLETAGMVHDLGHPPFGHVAEAALMRILSDEPNRAKVARGAGRQDVQPEIPSGYHLPDSFEGNAQSFRIVTRLSFGRNDASGRFDIGLNLTKGVLSGMCKYPWLHSRRPKGVDVAKQKWGAYDSEMRWLSWCMKGVNTGGARLIYPDSDVYEYRTIEAQAMDWADDITYAVHDLEDFCRAGLIPVDDLTAMVDRLQVTNFWEYCRAKIMANRVLKEAVEREGIDLDDQFSSTRRFLSQIQGAAAATRLARENLRGWAAGAIDNWTGPYTLQIEPDSGVLRISTEALLQVEILKNLTWYFVIDRPALGSSQRGQERLIRELFIWLVSWVEDSYKGLPPGNIRRDEYAEGGLPSRLIDFLDIAFKQEPSDGGYQDERKSTARAVVDYIVSLTERQTIDLHARLGGTSVQSMLEGWFAI